MHTVHYPLEVLMGHQLTGKTLPSLSLLQTTCERDYYIMWLYCNLWDSKPFLSMSVAGIVWEVKFVNNPTEHYCFDYFTLFWNILQQYTLQYIPSSISICRFPTVPDHKPNTLCCNEVLLAPRIFCGILCLCQCNNWWANLCKSNASPDCNLIVIASIWTRQLSQRCCKSQTMMLC